MTADQLIGQNVRNANGENIGEINDVVLNKDKAVFAILDVGGFLGIGEKQVAVPFERLQMGDNEAILMSDVTADELKGLPAWQEGAADWQQLPRDQRVINQ
jgi:sporulation protein YlmC with PRC-barrel domain